VNKRSVPAVRRSVPAARRAALAAGAVLLGLAPTLVAGQAADASDGGSTTVTCTGGSSCVIELENEVQFTGNWSRGSNNTGVSIAPPACVWDYVGNAQAGSAIVLLTLYESGRDVQYTPEQRQLINQAEQLRKQSPMPAGGWYQIAYTGSSEPTGWCAAQPLFEWVTPGKDGVVNPPPVQLPPQSLAQLALAVMKLPRAGSVVTSPAGKTYANMPTFVRVTLNGRHEMAGGTPYLVVSASLDGVGATAWAYGAPLTLTASGGDAQLWSKCGPLGSQLMADDPGAVAKTGVGGSADCGFTPYTPGTTTITADMGWRTCWVPVAEGGYPAPPANCTPVPDAQLDALQWQDALNVYEIQTNNG
jgi:hypothetical protein